MSMERAQQNGVIKALYNVVNQNPFAHWGYHAS